MTDYLRVAGILLEVLLLFNLIIVAHELGHFLAARWRGLVVEKFGIWFGRPLWKKTIGGVEYSLGSIPAGGFVALPQLAPMESVEGESKHDRSALPPVSAMDKIIVALSGPAASMALALLCAVLVWAVGRPVSEAESTTVIGYVVPDGPAAKAGLLPGDRILEVNNHAVTKFSGMGNMRQSVSWNVVRSEEPLVPVKFERDGVIKTVEVEPTLPVREGWGRKKLRDIGIRPAQTPMVARVFPDSPAALAGLHPRDLIVAVDNQPLRSLASLSEYLDTHKAGEPVTLTVKRDQETLAVTVIPQVPEGDSKPRIGILWDDRGLTTLVHPNPWELVVGSVRTMLDTLSAVFSPRSDIKAEHLSGPVGIMRIYYLLFESPDGWRLALWFSVVLNVNLALLNLLPIPVLDGGHIVLAIIEAVRRRPVSARVLEKVQGAFAMLIIGYMLYITFFDVVDLPWRRAPEPSAPELKFSPDKTTPAPTVP
ncbi:MAG: RIP metalloprotease RseP [Chthoniobacterales bacterium]|nr:RIP metalloprotease RseP [Chthoniobacterales bacterium]